MSIRRAFALVEAAAVAGVLVGACCIAAVTARQGRLAGGLAGSMSNLKRFAEVTANHAADNDDRFWTYSWKAGDSLSQWPDLNNAGTDLEAAANQAVDILRRRFDPSVTRLSGWLPHVKTSALVLADYLDEPLPMPWAVSPGDAALIEWQSDPYALGDSWSERRLAFWSSYEMPTAFVSPDEMPTLRQNGAHYNQYSVPGDIVLGGRRVAEVAYPAHKVHLSENASWFFGPRPAWYLEPEARVLILFVDGSVAASTTTDANAAWDPGNSSLPDYLIRYEPVAEWEVPALDADGEDIVSGKYRWTRRGLRGVDFDGERVE